MKNVEMIGIDSDRVNNNLSKLISFILNEGNYNSVLIKDDRIEIKEGIVKDIDTNIEDLLQDEKKKNIVIVNTNKNESNIEKSLVKKFDLLVITKNSKNDDIDFKMYDNLKKSGVVIANGDSKYIFKYFEKLKDNIVITYGLSARSTLTTSSIDYKDLGIDHIEKINICLQRGITNKYGHEVEPFEFPLKITDRLLDIDILPVIGAAMFYGIPIEQIQNSLLNYK